MRARLFDPFSEDALNAWLLTTPVKVIHSAQLFELSRDGEPRQVALVFYEDERELGASPPPARSAHASTDPLFALLDPYFHPERPVPRDGWEHDVSPSAS